MIINQANWKKYVQQLSSISKTAGNQLQAWIDKNGIGDMVALINYAIALSDKYGEAGASLAAQMYDEIAQMSGVSVPLAEVAKTATYKEVTKAMYGTVKDNQKPSATMERLVKQASADTMQKNAIRDGAEWAWIPSGDSCAFCITLASRGWQKASKKTLKGDHADHIHAHCDCQFMIRFNSNTNVEGYNPQEYRRIYDNAEGTKPQDKINAIRRMQNYKPVIKGEKISTTLYQNGVTKTLEVFKAEGYENVYLTENADIKRKALQKIVKYDAQAKLEYEITEINPKIVIGSAEDINWAEGKFDAVNNTIYYSDVVDDKSKTETSYGWVEFHENWHVKQAEKYIKKYGDILEENYNAYIDEAKKTSKQNIDKLGITSENVSEISDYAKQNYEFQRYDEVEAEYMASQRSK